MATPRDIRNRSLIVMNEREIGANTETRVGGLFVEIADMLNQIGESEAAIYFNGYAEPSFSVIGTYNEDDYGIRVDFSNASAFRIANKSTGSWVTLGSTTTGTYDILINDMLVYDEEEDVVKVVSINNEQKYVGVCLLKWSGNVDVVYGALSPYWYTISQRDELRKLRMDVGQPCHNVAGEYYLPFSSEAGHTYCMLNATNKWTGEIRSCAKDGTTIEVIASECRTFLIFTPTQNAEYIRVLYNEEGDIYVGKIADVCSLTGYSSVFFNGTYNNKYNTNYISTTPFKVEGGSNIQFSFDYPLSAPSNEWVADIAIYRKNGTYTLLEYQPQNELINMPNDAIIVGISLVERNSSKQEIAHRVGNMSLRGDECHLSAAISGGGGGYVSPSNIVAYYKQNSLKIDNLFTQSNLVFAHMTDVHKNEQSVSRIVDFCNGWANRINLLINSGDTVSFLGTEGLSWYDNIIANLQIPSLNCTGNHDWWQAEWQNMSESEVHNLVIKKVLNNPLNTGIVGTTGKSYYYYDKAGFRIIVLSAMYHPSMSAVSTWSAEQLSWLNATLNGAKSKGLAVICVNHTPVGDRVADMSTAWNDMLYQTDDLVLPSEAMAAVQTFINGGGEFVAWFGGHTHHDGIMTSQQYPQQICIAPCSSSPSVAEAYILGNATSTTDVRFDRFNLVGIDKTLKLIKMVRIGATMDMWLRPIETLCINYATGNFVKK